MAAPTKLPPGPRYPALIQGVGFWTRPLVLLEARHEGVALASTIAGQDG